MSEIPSSPETQAEQNTFTLRTYPPTALWRAPQIGALEAVASYWTLEDPEPALISMPTGSGKTAVAIALRYMAQARRTLVVVPGQDLRRQIADEFETERTVRRIGAVVGDSFPLVHEHVGRDVEWADLLEFDVVIAIPSSISPAHMSENPPPPDLFDLVIVDEAHHAPAPTWKSILDHFSDAKRVLLTATPRRRDGRALPGKHIFHYPLRLALQNHIYKPVSPHILDLAPHITPEARDSAIRSEVVGLANRQEHEGSAVLVRAASVERAEQLAEMYSTEGLACLPLHNRLSKQVRDDRVDSWRLGSVRALAVVGMLGEGIDVPNLRIVGYHDKHKSTNATIQLIGRLARNSPAHPQDSVLVTARDHDVYPALQGALRALYEEDASWADVLPSLIDDDLEAVRRIRDFAAQFDDAPARLSLPAVRPMTRVIVFESAGDTYAPEFAQGTIPEDLQVGHLLRGQEIIYSGLHSSNSLFVVVTRAPVVPRWYDGDGLTQSTFDLHVVSWHPSPATGLPSLLFMNSKDAHIANELRTTLDPDNWLLTGGPDAIQQAFESIERVSVSNVGVRSTQLGAVGTTTYATFAGSGVDRGLREADTQGRGLGHAMAQVNRGGSSVTAGFSSGKAKYWETRHVSLLEYQAMVQDFASRYWRPKVSASGTFLPNVARPTRTEAFASRALVAELKPTIRGSGWMLADLRAIEDLELEVEDSTSTEITLALFDPRTGEMVWKGRQLTNGSYTDIVGATLQRGEYGDKVPVSEVLERIPPSIYFGDGSTVYGAVTYAPSTTQTFLPDMEYTPWDWTGTDILKESKKNGRVDTIHDTIESRLRSATSTGQRWILCNDGGGEIADHIVIERDALGRLKLELWHAKASSNVNPAVRVTDMQVVSAQALKSRRHFTDKEFWKRLGRRLDGIEAPTAHLIDGDLESLRAMCGLIEARHDERIDVHPPALTGRIVVAQPGLSIAALKEGVASETPEISVGQVREFLTALHNATAGSIEVEIVGSV